ncbi:hypothetical protein MTO96_008759 [Rhipicephalus appendiculatus]
MWSSEETESSLKIKWDPPVRKNGALTGYKLNSSLSHTFSGILDKSWLPTLVLLSSSDSPEFYLKDLVPGSTYLVCVEAETSAGFGNAICDRFNTKDSVPDAPAGIWSSEQTEKSLKIQWDPPVHKNGALTGYKLNSSLYHTFNGVLDRSWRPNLVSVNSSDSPEFQLRSLVPGSTYLVCVEAETSAGYGNAICDNFSTKDAAPDAPASIWFSEETESSVKIQWDPPVRQNGALTGYKFLTLLASVWSSEQTHSSLKIKWHPPVRKNGALTGYKLNSSLTHTFNVIHEKSWLPKSIFLNTSDSPEFDLRNLIPGSTYSVCVEAETSAGFGNAICDDFHTKDSAQLFSLSHTFNGILAKSWAPKSDFLNSSDSPEYYLARSRSGVNVLGLCRGEDQCRIRKSNLREL